jgi:hypothetical protein
MAPKVTIGTPHDSPRLRYTLSVVLGRLLGWQWDVMTDRAAFAAAAGPKFGYGWPAPVWIPGVWTTGDPRPADLRVEQRDGIPVFFTRPEEGIGFDLLAACFFQLSRWEEYHNPATDRHGRFPALASHAYANGYLERPLVRELALFLAATLRAQYPALPVPERRFRLEPTYDIDIAWAYRYRGVRGWLAAGRDLLRGRGDLLAQRWDVLAGRRPDPFDTFARLDELHHRLGLEAVYFFLLATQTSRENPNPPPTTPALRELVADLAQRYRSGLHPSYYSSDDPELLREELATYTALTGTAARCSRQHFLRFRLPGTYRILLDQGIRADYSMGYADRVGFRAGMCDPFPWYDLAAERTTELMIHPFAAMDATLRRYEHLDAAAAEHRLRTLAGTVRRTGGTFQLLWHNSSFSGRHGWQGWWRVYERLLTDLADY